MTTQTWYKENLQSEVDQLADSLVRLGKASGKSCALTTVGIVSLTATAVELNNEILKDLTDITDVDVSKKYSEMKDTVASWFGQEETK